MLGIQTRHVPIITTRKARQMKLTRELAVKEELQNGTERQIRDWPVGRYTAYREYSTSGSCEQKSDAVPLGYRRVHELPISAT